MYYNIYTIEYTLDIYFCIYIYTNNCESLALTIAPGRTYIHTSRIHII
jgi:hypothetical protein